MKAKVTYTQEALPFILEALELSTTINNYVVNKMGDFVKDVDGKKFKAEQLIGVFGNNFITKPTQILGLPIKEVE